MQVRSSFLRRAVPAVVAVVAVAALATLPAHAATIKEQRSFGGETLTVRNLIGEIVIEGHGGGDFEVEITIQGADATRGLVRIEDSASRLDLVFPDEGRFVYPRMGAGSRTRISLNEGRSDWLGLLMGRGRGKIEVSGKGNGIEVWADLKIRMPAGRRLVVRHGVGELHAMDIDGEGEFAVRSGAIEARRLRGTMLLDTGSGHVEVSDVRGELTVDTGSGHVNGRDLEGDLISIDTGSGHVKLDRIDTRKLHVDTGSGRVEAARVSADSAEIDTGSGGVTLELDRMGRGNFKIDTGSGGIKLRIPEGAGADVHADTGSGGIHIDLGEAVEMRRLGRDEARFTVGGGGARVVLDTGSGGIRITR